jgi:hypothetical protein
MSVANLLKHVDLAFKNQDNNLGLTLLREYCAENTKDTDQLYRLAVIEEQIGLEENAIAAYLQCIKNIKNFMKAYLYGGYLLQKKGLLEKALAIYSLGNDQDERLSRLHHNENLAYETRLRSHTANIALRQHFTDLHTQSIGSNEGNSKIKNAVWPQTHTKPVEYLTEKQRPHLFYIPELSAKPVHDNNNFLWSKFVEGHFSEMTSEFSELLNLIKSKGTPYLDDGYKHGAFDALAGSENWTALSLFKDGVANSALLALMPKTAAILEQLPLYKLDENPFEVFFSLLKAGQHITPHFGQSNHSLTVHLPIVVPKGGYLTVADQKIFWQKGKVIIFDDSFEHEAINPSNEDRVVLIFSIWHPGLTKVEQQEVLASFRARAQWLESRNQHLD